ncbi:MAG: LLM class F420-dependent oxidoreductase [Actinomycetota bacterium]|nr:LLM class F420-dependent oxidoreductase [Actinomycetota bacterium]
MKLGLALGYWGGQPPTDALELAKLAEDLGYDSVWTAEAYGSDVFSPLCWIGAHTSRIKLGTGIVQMSARTPVATAMTALTIDHLSNGRLVLGLGVSGPQVVEGWYGQPFPKPLARTREYVDIIRQVLRREKPVTNAGEHYPLPYPGGTGLGKPLRSIVHPLRADIPIILAAEGQRNVSLAVDIADGWMPIFYSPYRNDVYEHSLGGMKPGFEVPCVAPVMVGDDVAELLMMVKWFLALYIGGMGAKDKNFHFDVIGRMGFADEAKHVQDLYLANDRAGAAAAVPDEFADEISLVGPPERIKERLEAWRASPVTSLLLGTRDRNALKLLADVMS